MGIGRAARTASMHARHATSAAHSYQPEQLSVVDDVVVDVVVVDDEEASCERNRVGGARGTAVFDIGMTFRDRPKTDSRTGTSSDVVATTRPRDDNTTTATLVHMSQYEFRLRCSFEFRHSV